MNTLHHLILVQLGLWHTTDAGRVEIRLLGLNAAQTTQLFIALFLPLCDEVRIGIRLLE